MNTEIKKLWTDALRSGKYKQGFGALHKVYVDKHVFCPLGVLCDLHSRTFNIPWTVVYDEKGHAAYSYLDQQAKLPKEVMEWAELYTNDPVVAIEQTITSINDTWKLPFAKIAGVIERDL